MVTFRADIDRGGFFRASTVLVSGTAVGQALVLLALPVLTRLYSPEDFSVLAVFVAFLAMFSVISCLRLEVAIPISETDLEAANLLALALCLALISALLVGIGVYCFGPWLFQTFGQPQLTAFGWLLPLGVWLAGSYAAFLFWGTRKKRFATIARTRVLQAGSGVGTMLGLGFLGAGPIGLFLGHMLLSGAGAMTLGWKLLRAERDALKGISLRRMGAALQKYRRFPQYASLETFAEHAATHLAIVLIAALALGPEAGFVLLAMRALGAPVNMIANALRQVFISQAADEARAGRLPDFTAHILKIAALVTIGPLVFVAIIAPDAFAVIFGEQWRRAGELVLWMMPWFVLKLLSAPVAMVMHVLRMQRAMLVLMLSGLCLRIAMTLGAYAIDAAYIAEGYAISGMVVYLLALSVYLRVARAPVAQLLLIARSAGLSLLIGLIAGVVALSIIARIGL